METKFVKKVKTPITKSEAWDSLKAAWANVFGGTPTDKQLCIPVAQWAIETGWSSKMFNYNFGGIKGVDPKSGMTTEYGTKEGYGETERKTVGGFRAYENATDGAEDYLNLLKEKFPKAVECMKLGDAKGFVNQLKGVYFTGDPTLYMTNLTSICRSLLAEHGVVVKPKAPPAPVAKKPKQQVATTKAPAGQRRAEKPIASKPTKPVKKRSEYLMEQCSIFLKMAVES